MSADPAIDLIEPRIREALAVSGKRPFVVGLCGSQGSGKSTVSAGLKARFEASGLRVALLSLDDLYLPREDREALAASVHPLFRTRGVPGTHDTALGEALITACGRKGIVALPSFSKEDDTRRAEAEWTRVDTPIDIVLFEGWCVGARPQREAALAAPVNALEAEDDGDGIWRRRVNQRLAGDYQRLFACIDYLVMLAAPGFGVVSAWRREQEHKLRAALAAEGKGLAATLDDAGVDRFIQHYQRLTEHMLTEMPARAELCILLDADRRPRLRERGEGFDAMTLGDAFPLTGLRVIEIGHFVAAPFSTRLLADLGADVIKIEPREGDPVRTWGEQIDGNSLWWSVHGRGKRSITLNLKDPRAKEIVKRLARTADAVVENFRPGQLDKLGIGPDVLRAERPGLIIAHISGYGQTGPYRDRAAFGVIGEAIGGIRYLTDQPPEMSDLPPVRVGISIGDSLAGIYAAFGLVAALWQRDRDGGDGKSRTIDVALTESVLSLMEGTLPEYGRLGKIRQPAGGGIATAAPTNAYPASDGGFVLIAANSEPLFAKLMILIGRPELIGVPRFAGNQQRVANTLELDEIIRTWSRQHDSETLIRLLKEADVPSSKVYTAADIAADPQYRERGMVREVEDPTFDQPVLHPGIVPHFGGEPAAVRWPGPPIGAHNDEVLQGLLGMSPQEVAALREEGVI